MEPAVRPSIPLALKVTRAGDVDVFRQVEDYRVGLTRPVPAIVVMPEDTEVVVIAVSLIVLFCVTCTAADARQLGQWLIEAADVLDRITNA